MRRVIDQFTSQTLSFATCVLLLLTGGVSLADSGANVEHGPWADGDAWVAAADIIVVGVVSAVAGGHSTLRVDSALYGHVAGDSLSFDRKLNPTLIFPESLNRYDISPRPRTALWFIRRENPGTNQLVARLFIDTLTTEILDVFLASLDSGLTEHRRRTQSAQGLLGYRHRALAVRNFVVGLRKSTPAILPSPNMSGPYRDLRGVESAALADSEGVAEYIDSTLGIACPLNLLENGFTQEIGGRRRKVSSFARFEDARSDTVSVWLSRKEEASSYGYVSVERTGRRTVQVAPGSAAEKAVVGALVLYAPRLEGLIDILVGRKPVRE